MHKKPLEVCVTRGSSSVAYALYEHLAGGSTWGPDQPISLRMLDANQLPKQEAMKGIMLELEDSTHSLLVRCMCTANPNEALNGADVVIIIPEQRSEAAELKDLMDVSCSELKDISQEMSNVASDNVKVLVVGPGANTDCQIVSAFAPNVARWNITGLSRLEYNRGVGALAKRADVSVDTVHNLAVWGSMGKVEVLDTSNCTIEGNPAREVIGDDEWLSKIFVKSISERSHTTGDSSALSLAQAISDHLHDWMMGTPPGRHIPMSVDSIDNNYGITPGLFFSFPCTCQGGEWRIVDGIPLDDAAREKLRITENDLLDCKTCALESIKSSAEAN